MELVYLYRVIKPVQCVPWSYRTLIVILNELVNHGYLCGVSVHAMFGGSLVVSESRPRVTMEGVAFIEENFMMGKAKAFLKEAKAAVPFV